MKNTLISAIGIGRRASNENDAPYQRTCYAIDGKNSHETPFFVHAWLSTATAAQAVDRIELIRTATSSWSALVEEFRDEDLALWERLESATAKNGPGCTDDDLAPLARILSHHWQREVHCHVLSHNSIDDQASTAVLDRLLALMPTEKHRGLVLDTTHGFRTLPLLAMSALHLADALYPGLANRTTLIYGEFSQGSARGIEFTSVQTIQRQADALRRFTDTLDAEPLAEALADIHPSLAKALRALGLCLAANRFSALDERLRQVRNAIATGSGQGSLLSRLRDAISALLVQLEHKTLAQRLIALARLRGERGQYGLGILALAEAASSLASPQGAPDYESMKTQGRQFEDALTRQQAKSWRSVFHDRNRIAHGANLIDHPGAVTEQNLRDSFETHLKFMTTISR